MAFIYFIFFFIIHGGAAPQLYVICKIYLSNIPDRFGLEEEVLLLNYLVHTSNSIQLFLGYLKLLVYRTPVLRRLERIHFVFSSRNNTMIVNLIR